MMHGHLNVKFRMSNSEFGYCSHRILQVLPLKHMKETSKMNENKFTPPLSHF